MVGHHPCRRGRVSHTIPTTKLQTTNLHQDPQIQAPQVAGTPVGTQAMDHRKDLTHGHTVERPLDQGITKEGRLTEVAPSLAKAGTTKPSNPNGQQCFVK